MNKVNVINPPLTPGIKAMMICVSSQTPPAAMKSYLHNNSLSQICGLSIVLATFPYVFLYITVIKLLE